MDFPSTEEYLSIETEILTAIKKKEPFLLNKNLNKAIVKMRDEFKEYLKNKNTKNLQQAKSFFYNLSHLLQKKFILILKNSGFSHNELIKSFAKVDSGRVETKLDEIYKIIKKFTQTLDQRASYKGKSIWHY